MEGEAQIPRKTPGTLAAVPTEDQLGQNNGKVHGKTAEMPIEGQIQPETGRKIQLTTTDKSGRSGEKKEGNIKRKIDNT